MGFANNDLVQSAIEAQITNEENKEEELTSYLRQLLGPFQQENIESVVLGCTHYPLIIEKIEAILGKVKFYDGGEGIANHPVSYTHLTLPTT